MNGETQHHSFDNSSDSDEIPTFSSLSIYLAYFVRPLLLVKEELKNIIRVRVRVRVIISL